MQQQQQQQRVFAYFSSSSSQSIRSNHLLCIVLKVPYTYLKANSAETDVLNWQYRKCHGHLPFIEQIFR